MQKVIVGISGGVDSAVSALLLKEQGYRVEGLFMQNWVADKDDAYCSTYPDLQDARAVCEKLNIPLHTVSFAKEYWDKVFQHFLDEYAAGRTPNPDILCNKEIKFKAFLDYAVIEKADYIAMGHYARTRKDQNHWQLLKGLDSNKDQSYFLYTLNQSQLAKSLFPIGELEKPTVRAIAKQHHFPNFAKKDSTGICFIGERRFKQFLKEYLLVKPGTIETDQGEVIGQHEGLMYYTLGQRQGIGIGGLKSKMEAPWYVLQKDIPRNVLIVGQNHHHPLLMCDHLQCQQLHWISGQLPALPFQCKAKIRYRQLEQDCRVEPLSADCMRVTFKEKQRAITPGQSVVFYNGEVCLGGGIIT